MRAFLYVCILSLVIQHSAYGIDKIQYKQLENGFNVYVVENHHLPIVTHIVSYHVGGINDPQGKSGLAHFLEHLMFRGTKDVKDITSIIQINGGIFNASTSNYYTNYFEMVPSNQLPLMMELESDRMHNLQITEDSIVAERKIVAEERKMRIDNNPEAQLEEEMLSAFYHNNNGWQVAGWLNEINTLGKDDAEYLYNKYYHSSNATLLVAGDVTMDEVLPLAEKYYGKITTNKALKQDAIYEPEHKADVTISLINNNASKQELKLWYQAPNINDENAIPLKLASIIIGEGRSSHLYKKLVATKEATVANIYYSPFTKGSAIFEIHAIPYAHNQLIDIQNKIIELINDISVSGITTKELTRAKNMLKSSLIYSTESSLGQALFYNNMVMSDTSREKMQTLIESIEAVTIEEIQNSLQQALHKKKKVIGYLLPGESNNEL